MNQVQFLDLCINAAKHFIRETSIFWCFDNFGWRTCDNFSENTYK